MCSPVLLVDGTGESVAFPPGKSLSLTSHRKMASSTLTGLLKQVAGQFPSRRAVQFDLTHARLQELIDQVTSELVASGVKPGDIARPSYCLAVQSG
ncbi:hypothetical protein RHMOL_Rhmol01G0370400 [Rhododendron molle]|uniref:Uncharacterized protein n=1 Tax=Rhododendron molle TaxID=49168 RepID=A0ACC0QBA9_RHOML|nr:hypothetical protein RHMOL_Rhmol01G0370400 [Rhododendron molle]